jgi:uncharacterized protein (DUF952 family)
MSDKPRYTFHYTPMSYFDRLDPAEDYVPAEYGEEGFIHCTDGAANMAKTANKHFGRDPRDFWALYIEKEQVRSPIKYEDPREIYPHIYGPLNRDAIVRMLPAVRDHDGTFLAMPEMT